MTDHPLVIAAFVALAIVMAGLGGWTHHKRKERATSHEANDDEIFQRAPAWGKRLNEKLNTALARLSSLKQQVGLEAWADEKRDQVIMAMEDDILAQLAAAKTRDDGFRVLLKAIKDNQNNPAKLQQIAASISENGDAWTAAFEEGVPEEPPPV